MTLYVCSKSETPVYFPSVPCPLLVLNQRESEQRSASVVLGLGSLPIFTQRDGQLVGKRADFSVVRDLEPGQHAVRATDVLFRGVECHAT